MKIDLIKGRIHIEGKGVTLLHLKAKISQAILAENIRHEGIGKFSISADRVHTITDMLLQSSGEISKAAKELLLSQRSNLVGHLSARNEVYQILEKAECVTGDEFWDEQLDPQQGIAVNALCVPGLGGLCLFDEQGSGKTVMSIAAFDIMKRRQRIDNLIVIAPKSMISEWAKEFNRFLPGRYKTTIVDGDRDQKLQRLQEETDVYILNYESVDRFLSTLKGIGGSVPTLLIVDESYYVKNPFAIRSGAIRELRSACKMAIMLCGTPAPNGPEDIIHQFNIADNGVTFEGYHIPDDPELAKTEVNSRIEDRGIYIRRLKEEIIANLPEKRFKIDSIEMSGKQRFLYDNASHELVLFLKGLDNTTFRKYLTTYFQKRSALLQICVSPRLVDPLYDESPAKYVYLDELLNKLVETQKKKVIIWSFFRGSIDDMVLRYKKYGVVRVDGSVSSSNARKKSIEMFQTDPQIRLFVGNPGAAGSGITLHAAAHAIYLSYSNQAAHYLQSIDRIHRRGQISEYTEYHLLACKGTIEEKEIHRLRNKERQQQNLLGDKVEWPSSLDEAISELEGSD